ncbi:MAG: hypothetical protein R3F60_08420 [bacterium]
MGRRVRLTLGFTQDAPAWIGRQERDVRSELRRDLRNQGVQDLRALALRESPAWVPCGPAGIPRRRWSSGRGRLPVSGMVSGLAVGGATGTKLHAATDGGVWASTDGGTSWAPPSDARTSLGVGAVARVDAGARPSSSAAQATPTRGPCAPGPGPGAVLRRGPLRHPLDGGVGASGFAARDINAILAVAPDRLLVATDQGLFYSGRRQAELQG